MSILAKCEEIGKELKQTPFGKHTYSIYSELQNSMSKKELYLFNALLEQYHVSLHFFAPDYALHILRGNTENEILKNDVITILKNPLVKEFVAASKPLGILIENVTVSAFLKKVQYELPADFTITPRLLRLVHRLSVECQRIHIARDLAELGKKDLSFPRLIKEFDSLKKNNPNVPFSREERKIIKKLIDMGYVKESVQLIHKLMNIMSLVKAAVYCGFFGTFFEFNKTDILYEINHILGDITVKHLHLIPDLFVSTNKKVIMRMQSADNIKYGLVMTKRYQFGSEVENKYEITTLEFNQL